MTYSLSDIEYHETAVRLNIANKASAEVQEAAFTIMPLLEKIKKKFPEMQIISWYRSEALEREVSRFAYATWCIKERIHINADTWHNFYESQQHSTGKRVSFRVPNKHDEVVEFLKDQDFDVLIVKDHWLSVSVSEENKRNVRKEMK